MSDGISYRCKSCDKECFYKYIKTEGGVLSQIYSTQKRSSKARGHAPPSYSKKELSTWLYEHGFKEIYKNWVLSGYKKVLKPSVDRKNDYLPYTLDNLLRVCTWGENRNRSYLDRKNGINNKGSRAVIQMSLQGIILKKYYSVMQAERASGVRNEHIHRVCKNRRKTAGGYIWKYETT